MNPEERLSITELVNQLQEIAAARNVNPKSPITEVGVCRIVFSALGKKRYYSKLLQILVTIKLSSALLLCSLRLKQFSELITTEMEQYHGSG